MEANGEPAVTSVQFTVPSDDLLGESRATEVVESVMARSGVQAVFKTCANTVFGVAVADCVEPAIAEVVVVAVVTSMLEAGYACHEPYSRLIKLDRRVTADLIAEYADEHLSVAVRIHEVGELGVFLVMSTVAATKDELDRFVNLVQTRFKRSSRFLKGRVADVMPTQVVAEPIG